MKKKIAIVLISIISLVGCTSKNDSASKKQIDKLKTYLNGKDSKPNNAGAARDRNTASANK